MRDCNKCPGPGFDPTEQTGPVYLGGVLGIDVNGVRQPIDAEGIVHLAASTQEAVDAAERADQSAEDAAGSATEAAGSATDAAGSATAAAASAAAAQTAAERDVPAAAAAWLAEHVDPETGYVLDDSLTIQGAAADAKAVGDRAGADEYRIDNLDENAVLHTENLLYFDNLDTRTYDNELTIWFPNDSTISFYQDGVSTANRTFNALSSNRLNAGKTYVFYRKVLSGSGTINLQYYRVGADGTETRITHGAVFTPTQDEYFRVRFIRNVVNVGSVLLYIAEKSLAANEEDIVPHSITPGPELCGNIKKGKNVYLNVSTADIVNLHDSNDYCVAVIPCKPYDRFSVLAYGQVSPRTWGFLDENSNVIIAASENTDTTSHIPLEPVTLKAPQNAAYLVINHNWRLTGYYPKIAKLSPSDILNRIGEDKGVVPAKTNPRWKAQVVSAYDTFIAIRDGNLLKLSADCGITFNDGVDISGVSGVINKYHLYANGCLAFFTHTAAYYIESGWSGYQEAALYEADGATPYNPATLENFYSIYDYAKRKFVNGQDWYVFGNYVTSGGDDTRKLLWCSTDNGHSYKIIYEFNLQNTYTARHVHSVYYYEAEDLYIVTTGDAPSTECWVLALKYADGAWTVTKLAGSSADYKWAGLDMWGEEIYYTYDNTPGAVRKCKFADIADLSKHETVLDDTPNDCTGILIGPKGDMIVTLSWWRSNGTSSSPLPQEFDARKIYYSPDRKVFWPIYTPPHILNGYSAYSTTMPITCDGHAIMGVHKSNTSNWTKLPSVFLDELVKKAGFPNAFDPM